MTPLYLVDPGRSRFTVHAVATGLLSAFAHSPTFSVGDLSGSVRFDPDAPGTIAAELTVNADSLRLEDQVRHADRAEIEDRMRSEVLETARFPEVTFRTEQAAADPAGPGRYRVALGGRLSLHGVTFPCLVEGVLTVDGDGGLRLRGDCPLRMSDFRIRPVTAVGGTIRLKDEVRISFDIAARPEGP
jgi:polyisoprenoid-binding protein YceI